MTLFCKQTPSRNAGKMLKTPFAIARFGVYYPPRQVSFHPHKGINATDGMFCIRKCLEAIGVLEEARGIMLQS